MSFAERYSNSVNSPSLQDDAFHHSTDALQASALASRSAKNSLGALMTRVKYADGIAHKDFEGNSQNIGQLLAAWTEEVRQRSREHGWVKVAKTEWDIKANESFYRQVAATSIAHWIDNRCEMCAGTGIQIDQHMCPVCQGTKLQPMIGGRLVIEKSQAMAGELEGIYQSYTAKAASLLRRMA